jgi:uncharacterized protein (TIGR00251 family)
MVSSIVAWETKTTGMTAESGKLAVLSTEGVGRPLFVSPAAAGGWYLVVRVQPGAKKSEFAGVREGRLCIRLAAPAVENKANKALTAFVAEALGLRATKVTLLSGETGRQKRLLVQTAEEPDWGRLLS